MNISCLLLTLLWFLGRLPDTYGLDTDVSGLAELYDGRHQDDEKLTLQEEGQRQAPYTAFIASFEEIFCEPDDHRGKEHHPDQYFFGVLQKYAGFCAHTVYSIEPAKSFYATKSRSIYLLDCTFLI